MSTHVPVAPPAYTALRIPYRQKARNRALIAGGLTLLLGARSAWLGRKGLRLLREQVPLSARIRKQRTPETLDKLKKKRTQRRQVTAQSKKWRNAAIWSVPIGGTYALLPLAQYEGFKTHAKYVTPVRLDDVVLRTRGPMQIVLSKQRVQQRVQAEQKAQAAQKELERYVEQQQRVQAAQ